MGLKSVGAAVITFIGGFAIGYAWGVQSVLETIYGGLEGVIEFVVRSSIFALPPAMSSYISTGVSDGLREYVAENYFDPAPLIAVGAVLALVGVIVAFRVWDDSWRPWGKSED